MDVSAATSELFSAAGLEIRTLGAKGRGVFAKEHLKCGQVLLREKGFHAKDMEKLADLVVASEEGRHAASGMYAGPLHHLTEGLRGIKSDERNSDEWLDMYSKVRYNCFQLDGSALLPNMALFNHNCWPNASLVRVAPFTECNVAMIVIARDGIAPGQEVEQCYDSDLILTPLHARRRQLMSTWNFMCKCDRCDSDEASEDACERQESQAGAVVEITDDDFADLSSPRLCDAKMYFGREEVMHKPGLSFKLRRQVFSAQLAAACRLLPHLHPKLRDLYQQLEDLCEPSASKEHCQRVCKFYEEMCGDGHAIWDADAK